MKLKIQHVLGVLYEGGGEMSVKDVINELNYFILSCKHINLQFPLTYQEFSSTCETTNGWSNRFCAFLAKQMLTSF